MRKRARGSTETLHGSGIALRRPFFESLGSDRYSHLAINDLDRKLSAYLDFRGGTFIEAGANTDWPKATATGSSAFAAGAVC